MKLLNIFFISLCILPHLYSRSQVSGTPFIYSQRVLMAEEAMADENFEEALFQYKQLFTNANHVLAKDAYNACQLAAIQGGVDFSLYYRQCAKSGIPQSYLMKNPQIRAKVERDSASFKAVYREGFRNYQSRIDTALRAEFISRYALEQNSKGKSNYAAVCEDNFNRILQLAKEDRFPGENLIGPDEYLSTDYVLSTLLHFPYSYTLLKPYLLEALEQGFISPFAVCYLYGFNQTRTSVLYTKDIPVDDDNFKECYNLPFGKQSENTKEVNAQRKLRYLPSLETEQKLNAIAGRYRMNFLLG